MAIPEKLNICPKCGEEIDIRDEGDESIPVISSDGSYISIDIECPKCGEDLIAHYNLEEITLE